MVKIEIVSALSHERVIAPKNGRAQFAVNEQDAYAYTMDRNGDIEKHPQKIVLTLERGASPYAAGFYTILPQSIYVGKYGQLELGRLQLKKLAVSQEKSA